MAKVKSKIFQKSFEACKTPYEVETYLRRVLSRSGGKKEASYLYRYTNIEYLYKMLTTGYMRLGPCSKMNDPFETAVLTRHKMIRKLFYTCFTKVPESLAMYKLHVGAADGYKYMTIRLTHKCL